MLPAGPDPLMPNRLWYSAARPLFPQADSSIAWAMVTAAGTPHRCWAATAPGAIRLMNACCARVPGVACAGAEYCRYRSGLAAGVAAGVAAVGLPLGVADGREAGAT